MDELLELIIKKTGIPKTTAEQVVTIVINFLKEKLPGPVAGSLDSFLEGDAADDVLGGLMGMLGGKK